MKRRLLYRVCLFGTLVLCLSSPALGQREAPWEDCMEAYKAGEPLCGQGGWQCWREPIVTDACAHSGRKSIEMGLPDTDAIMIFTNAKGGKWELIAWQYIPSSQEGQTSFIMQSLYKPGGPYRWAVQCHGNAHRNTFICDFSAGEVDLITDEWVEIKVEMDFDNDLHQIYYGGTPVLPQPSSWREAMNGGNPLQVEALDLHGNQNCCVFYDDLSLQPEGNVRLTCCDTYGCQNDCGGVECTGRERMKLKCRRNKLKATVKKAQPDEWFIFRLDTGEQQQAAVKSNGKSKAKFKNVQPGGRTVTTDCDLRGQIGC